MLIPLLGLGLANFQTTTNDGRQDPLVCQQIAVQSKAAPALPGAADLASSPARLDPAYYNYIGCSCSRSNSKLKASTTGTCTIISASCPGTHLCWHSRDMQCSASLDHHLSKHSSCMPTRPLLS